MRGGRKAKDVNKEDEKLGVVEDGERSGRGGTENDGTTVVHKRTSAGRTA